MFAPLRNVSGFNSLFVGGALRDDTKYRCPEVKLGRILKLNLNSVLNSSKPYYKQKMKIG